MDGDGDGGSQDWQGGDDDGELISRWKAMQGRRKKKRPVVRSWNGRGTRTGCNDWGQIGWNAAGECTGEGGGFVEACARRRSVERLRRDQRSSKALDRWEASVANGGQWGGGAGTRMGRERNECGVEEE